MMATTTIDSPSLRLATTDGRKVKRRARPVKPLTEQQGEAELIERLGGLRQRLDRRCALWLEVATLLDEAEQRQARKAQGA